MKERKSKRAYEAADNGCNDRGAEQSKDTAQLIEFKWCAIKSLNEPCRNDRATGIGHGKNRRAGKIAIAEQIGGESGSNHADDDGPPYGRPNAIRNPVATPAAGQNTAMPSVLSSKARLRRAARKKAIATEIEVTHGGHASHEGAGEASACAVCANSKLIANPVGIRI